MAFRPSVLFFGALLLIFGFSNAKNWKVTGKGKITCDGEPMAGIRVKLMDDDLLFNDKMGLARTDEDGKFIVRGKGKDFIRGKPDPYILVEYEGRTGSGRLQIEKSLNVNQKHRFPSKKYKRHINFGHLNIKDVHCRSYIQFSNTLRAFKRLTGRIPPYDILHIRTEAQIKDGKPWASTDTVRIPKGYETISPYMAHHEFAHTFRDSYEGGYLTFLRDAVKYGYSQEHGCNKKTNKGFAFNEGWAKFWASQTVGGIQCGRKNGYGKSLWDYRYEGNVEQALNRIKKHCKATLYKMVNVLKNNEGRIYSLVEFRNKYKQMYKC